MKCLDCRGSGFLNGGSAGIYCPCPIGTKRELFDLDMADLKEWFESGNIDSGERGEG